MNSKQVNETVNRLASLMQDVKDGDLRTILSNMQKMSDYMAEKIRIYEEHLTALTGRKRPELMESAKRHLARKGKELNDFLLASVEPTWAPGTLRSWYNHLVGAKFNSTARIRRSAAANRSPRRSSRKCSVWRNATRTGDINASPGL